MRLRYEHVDQDGLPPRCQCSDAARPPGRPPAGRAGRRWWRRRAWSRWRTAIMTAPTAGRAIRWSSIPANIELNRAQLRYAGKDGLAVTAGRQRLNFADDRFVGNAPWRQSEQTFDAVRLQYGKALGPSLDLAYGWTYAPSTVATAPAPGRHRSAATMSSRSSAMAPGRARSAASPIWSTRTMRRCRASACRARPGALRFAGRRRSRSMSLGYVASWARQSDWRRNPNRYAADYWLGELDLSAKALSLTTGYEVLGAGTGVALTSVQTPLASYFKFNGWAGKFGTTPPGGLRDLCATLRLWLEEGGPARRDQPGRHLAPFRERSAGPALWRRTRPGRRREAWPLRAFGPLCALSRGPVRHGYRQVLAAAGLELVAFIPCNSPPGRESVRVENSSKYLIFLRHPRLVPGSRFFFRRQASGAWLKAGEEGRI